MFSNGLWRHVCLYEYPLGLAAELASALETGVGDTAAKSRQLWRLFLLGMYLTFENTLVSCTSIDRAFHCTPGIEPGDTRTMAKNMHSVQIRVLKQSIQPVVGCSAVLEHHHVTDWTSQIAVRVAVEC